MNSDTSIPQEDNSDASFNSDINFFQIGFDDLMIASKFSTYLFDQPPESTVQKLIFPQNTSIVDFLSDPVAFAAASTSEIVWSSIISPILTGKPETKAYMYQLLSLLFKYFKDHPIAFIENENNRRIENNNTANRERNKVVTSHYSSMSEIFPNSDEFISKILEDDISFPAQQKKQINPSLFELTQGLYSDAKQKLTERHAFAFFKWGLYSNDISSVIYSLLFFGKLLMQQKKFQKTLIDFSIYKDSFYTYPLNNAVFTQSLQSQTSSIELLGYKPLLGSSSMIGCDSFNFYALGNNGSITRINLSTENLSIVDRYTIIPLFTDLNNSSNNYNLNSRIGFATSNGYSIIIGIKSKPLLYKLPDFQFISELSFNQSQKLCVPLTSDGYYIYSLQTMKKKLNIFSLNQNGYSFIKSVTLQVRDKKALLEFNKIIPSDKNFSTFCNGTVFTIALFTEKTDNGYKYVFRHFSVIDGFHIIDHYGESKNGLLSICSYPWDRKVFEIVTDGETYSLVKLSNYSAQPLWLSNISMGENPTFSHEITAVRRLRDAFQYVLNFLSYYSIHFHGYSFRSYINNPVYFVPSSQFFAPCSLNVINSTIETIRFFILIYLPDSSSGSSSPALHSDSSFPKEWMKNSLIVLFSYLNMNLSNFANRKVEGKVTSIEGQEGPIVDCFIEVTKHEELQFLLPMIGFILANSFHIIFRNPSEKLNDLFFYLYQNLPSNNLFYLIKQISELSEFAYAFNSKKVRLIFSPILQKLKNNSIDQFEKELLSSYMRAIMLEMRQVYNSFQDSFSTKEEKLLESFHNFSTVVVEQATQFFITFEYNERSFDESKFDEIPFVKFFRKWLALLEPFPQFNRASLLITSIIQPINTTITQMIKKNNISCEPIPNEKRFHKISMIFYEIFSLFVNSISALLDGGAEIKDVCQYEWFVQSVKKGDVTSKKIKEWVQKLNLNVGVLSKGVSFIYLKRPDFNEQNVNLSDLAIFINDLSSTNPTQSTEMLMDYLHEKVKNPMNKKLTDEEKKIERIILAALVKQLGLTNELFNVRSELEKKENPVISHLVKQTMTSLYRIRNQIRLSKQMTAQFQTNNNENMSIQKPEKYEDYDKFIIEIMKKTAFLLNTEPWLRNLNSNSKEKDFSDMLKQIQSFITSKITIDQYLQMIDSAITSSKNISTGVAFITSKLHDDLIKSNTNADKVCSSYMIEKMSSNDSIQFYLSTLGKGVLQKDVANIVSLFPLLINMIENNLINISLYPLIVFFMNPSIIHFTKDSILNDIDKLVDLIINYSVVPKDEISLLLIFIASSLLNLIEIDSSFKENEVLIRILKKLINSNVCDLPIERICFKAGIEVPHKIEDLFLLLSNGSPTEFHIISLFIFDIISSETNKKTKFFQIFQILLNVSLAASGCDSLLMKDLRNFNIMHVYVKTHVFKSAPLIISGCSELIQICRRLLSQQDEEMKFVLAYILKHYVNEQKQENELIDDEIIQLLNKNNLLFGVFAVLSNLIEEIHSNSLIKNTKTNQIYYIESSNEDNSMFDVWLLPINQDSVKTKIEINSDFVPVSLMPFQVDLFADYSLLIPYFVDALNSKLNPGLSLLILASLREYSTNVSFLRDFVSKLDNVSLTNIDYTNSLPFYLKLLRSHLMQKSDGFLENFSNDFNDGFELFDIMCQSKSFSNSFTVSDSDACNKLFLTSHIIPVDNDFQILINISCSNYDVGVFCPTMSSNIDHLYYSKREDKAIEPEKVKIIYSKILGVSIIVKGSQKVSAFSKMIEKPFCLALNVMSAATVSCRFIKKLNATESIQKVNLDTMKRNEISLLNGNNDYVDNTFMSISYNVLASLPRSLSLASDSVPPGSKTRPILYELQREINQWQTHENTIKIPAKQSIFKYLSKSDNSYVFSTTRRISCLNNFTGEIYKIGKSEIEEIKSLPFINLNAFPVLPSQITNYYATGVVSECRNEAFNWLFINLVLNSDSIPFKNSIEMFQISSQDLLKHVLNLLLILEPILANFEEAENKNIECSEKVQIVNFDYNSLSPTCELKLTSLQMFSAAVFKIFEYIDKSGIQNEFADAWLGLLKKQFYNGFSHSCTPYSKSGSASLFLNMKTEASPVSVSRPGVLGWIVCVVGFSHHYSMNEKTRSPSSSCARKMNVTTTKHGYCLVNGSLMSEPLTVVLNPSVTIEFKKKDKTVVLIPITLNSNDSLIGSFFDLALSFKYFVHYVAMKRDSLKNCQFYRIQIYSHFFRGIMAKSPFFFTYRSEIFRFLQQNQKITSLDFTNEFVLSLNLLSLYCFEIPECENFLREASELWSERTAVSMMPFFPDFISDEIRPQVSNKAASDEDFKIIPSYIPEKVSSTAGLHSIISVTKRALKKFDTIKGYPYHILLCDWAKYTIMYPPYEVKSVSQKVHQITFLYFTPERAVINTKEYKKTVIFKVSDNFDMRNPMSIEANTIFGVRNGSFFIECETVDFVITSPLSTHLQSGECGHTISEYEDFIFHHRSHFTTDVRTFSTMMSSIDDQQILRCFSDKVFNKKKTLTFEFLEDPTIFIQCVKSLHCHLNVILLRAKFLVVFNWLVSHQHGLLETDADMRSLKPSVSISYKLSLFNEEIDKLSSKESAIKLTINRKEAVFIRLGSSTDLTKTIIYQMSLLYTDPALFRCKSDQPWTVHFLNEPGIDVGGVARELVSECAIDFMSPLCGLVVPVPNAINGIVENDDLFVPIASPKHDQKTIEKQYRFCGALIAICIRTGLVQQFLFPPLVWEYLLTGTVPIQRIFEIDKNYELLITSLSEALKSDMTNDEFINRFNLKFVVTNSVGLEVPLTQRGKTQIVDKSNCTEFIAYANRFRINELEQSLRPMKDGFWSNLGIKPLSIIDWPTLEFAACGQREISVESLVEITQFIEIQNDQRKLFWRVVESLSSKERSDLLKFWTGRIRLPPRKDLSMNLLKVDELSGTDILPTSSTCFYKLHLPYYSSFQKAYKMIKIAIEYSGTFENS